MKSKMTLSKLIEYVGDANVTVQPLQDNLVNIAIKRDSSEITFVTAPNKGSELAAWVTDPQRRPRHLCLVIWLPRDKLPPGKLAKAPLTIKT